MHETDSLPDGFAEGIWAKQAQQSELAELHRGKVRISWGRCF